MVSYPPPPPGRPGGGSNVREGEKEAWSADRVQTMATETLSWCTKEYKNCRDHAGVPYIIIGAMLMASFTVLGLAAALPIKGRAVLVNIGGFVLPALVTIKDMDKMTDQGTKPRLTGYWVLFGFFGLLDGVLSTFTPCYFFTKGCVLVWAGSAARPYGGRSVINRAFEIINSDLPRDAVTDHKHEPLKKELVAIVALSPLEDAAVQAGIPRRAFRLAIVALAVAMRTFALGIASYLVLTAEGLFADLPARIQARVCVIVGASWPLYATFLARSRSAAAAEYNGAKSDKRGRQGPAAVQWLSYWPIYALFVAVLDPILGWIPHFHSFKLVALAFLALPQTRGAYLVTSLVLYGEDRETGSSFDSPVYGAGGGANPLVHEEKGGGKVNCVSPTVIPVE